MAACNAAHDGFGTTHMFHTDPADPMYPQFPGYVVFLGASIIGFWYWCTDQHIVQRVLGQVPGEDNAKVIARARRGTIAAGFFKILPCFMFLIPGMIAYALSQNPDSGIVMDITDHESTDGAFAMMVKNILPAGIKGIVTIGFVCALVASLAAFFNSCATLFTEDFYKPMKKGMSEAHYVFVGRMATVVVVLLGLAWMPIMMNMGNLYSYLQDIQSLIAPAMVAVFTLGIFSKKITPKAGEWGLIGGFVIGMIRLLTNVLTDSGKAVMEGAFWENTTWFWQTNWLIFECWLLVFIIILMVVRQLLHACSLQGSGRCHHLHLRLQEEHPRELGRMGHRGHTGCHRSLRLLLCLLLVKSYRNDIILILNIKKSSCPLTASSSASMKTS